MATFYALFATTPAAAGRRPRLRRHRLPAGRRGGAVRRARRGPSGRPASRHGTAGRRGCAARASGCATARRRRWSRSPARRPRRSRSRRSTRSGVTGAPRDRLAAPAGATATEPPAVGPLAAPRPRRRRRPGVARRLPGERRLPALARALELGPEAVIAEVTASKLVGRGGAAFPTGRKWAAVAAQPAQPHYLVCNADESEPGTFKDRVLLEGDPFAIVEAMTIAAFATGALAGLPLHPRRVPRGRGARSRAAIDRRARGRAARRGHPRLGLRLRHRAPPRRRRLHLRRGDGAVRVDRGQARRAAQQAAVPGRGRAVRQADRRQQRRDAGQRPAHRARAAARRSPGSGPRARPVRSCSACRATSPGRASTRSSSGRRCAS